MRNAGVEQVVADLAPDADLEMIIEVNTEQAERNAVGIPDIGARMEKLRQVYREAKLPLIEALAHYQSEGLDIVNELPSTSQLILAGPASSRNSRPARPSRRRSHHHSHEPKPTFRHRRLRAGRRWRDQR